MLWDKCVCVFFFSWIFQGLYDSFPSLPSLDALTLAHRRACRVVTVGSNLPHHGCKGSKWSRKAFRGKRQLWKSRLCVSSSLTFGHLSVRRSPASLCLFPICGGENLHGAAVMLKIKFSAENTRIPLMWW